MGEVKQAWTAGKWHVDGFHMSAVICDVERDGRRVWARIAECDSDAFRNPDWRANARLIAAAPCLYEALQAAVTVLEHVATATGYALPSTMAQARTALSRALGEGGETR